MNALDVAAQARRVERAAQWSLAMAEDVSAVQAAQFQAWLEEDPANRSAYEGFNGSLRAVESFAGEPEMVRLRGEALTAARRSHDVLRAKAFFGSRLGRVAGVAAVGAVLAILGYRFIGGEQVLQTMVGERRVVAMTDGSQLSLDAATRVNVDFGRAGRRFVLEQGRARFDVAKDPLRPFTVQAGGKVVVALGTSFSVELVDDQVRVVLYDGRVEVLQSDALGPRLERAPRTDAATSDDTSLQPGNELVVASAGSLADAQVTRIDPVRSLAWEAGDLAFADEPLAVAVDRINRYSSQPVVIGEAAAASVRISGVFHAGDTEAFVDGVTRLFPVRAHRDDSGAVTLMFDAHAGRGLR